MKLLAHLLAMAVMLACVACTGNRTPVEVVNPIALPDIPARYVSETVIVPEELEDEYAVFLALPQSEYWNVDLKNLEGEELRAAIYWRFSLREAVGNGFFFFVNSSDRSAADDFIKRLSAGWGFSIVDSNYDVATQTSFYNLFWVEEPYFSKGETAWLCDWLLLNYPQFFLDILPHFQSSHSEGTGGAI